MEKLMDVYVVNELPGGRLEVIPQDKPYKFIVTGTLKEFLDTNMPRAEVAISKVLDDQGDIRIGDVAIGVKGHNSLTFLDTRDGNMHTVEGVENAREVLLSIIPKVVLENELNPNATGVAFHAAIEAVEKIKSAQNKEEVNLK